MNDGSHKRLPAIRRYRIIVATALMVSFAMLSIASPALATPKGIFAKFAQCPVTMPGVTLCSFAQTTGGEFSIGTTKVPINQTITLQGGGIPTGNPANEFQYFLVPAKDGNSLSKTPLNVPGGLTGLVNCTEIKGEGFLEKTERAACKAIFENKTTGVTATTELVANATNPAILDLLALQTGTPTALTLPVRVKLSNPLLGSSCFIGSETSPIQLHLITGTTSPPPPNKPITGKVGTIETIEEKEQLMLQVRENTLVDNSYSAPAASGCGGLFSFLIDPIINSKIGLPSAAGHNTAILSGTLNATSTEAVIASEKF